MKIINVIPMGKKIAAATLLGMLSVPSFAAEFVTKYLLKINVIISSKAS